MTGILISIITLAILSTGSESNEVKDALNQFLHALDHPFIMMVLGVAFWFTLKWSINRNKNGNKGFWTDQKDEVIVTMFGGLLFIVFDDEIIQMYYDFTNKEGSPELKPYFYLLVGPAVERLYKVYSAISKAQAA